jgi:hypothetical protein
MALWFLSLFCFARFSFVLWPILFFDLFGFLLFYGLLMGLISKHGAWRHPLGLRLGGFAPNPRLRSR